MKNLETLPTAKAREALKALEQAFAYYEPETQPESARDEQSEYYEYAPAA